MGKACYTSVSGFQLLTHGHREQTCVVSVFTTLCNAQEPKLLAFMAIVEGLLAEIPKAHATFMMRDTPGAGNLGLRLLVFQFAVS